MVRANLFKAFQAGTGNSGAGLGLAISAELVRAHGGDIALEDNGCWSRFRAPASRIRAQRRTQHCRMRMSSTESLHKTALAVRDMSLRMRRFAGPISAPVAQLDRAPDYELGVESSKSFPVRHLNQRVKSKSRKRKSRRVTTRVTAAANRYPGFFGARFSVRSRLLRTSFVGAQHRIKTFLHEMLAGPV